MSGVYAESFDSPIAGISSVAGDSFKNNPSAKREARRASQAGRLNGGKNSKEKGYDLGFNMKWGIPMLQNKDNQLHTMVNPETIDDKDNTESLEHEAA